MLRIGICDDSQEARFVLRSTLEKLAEEQNTEDEIYEFSSGEGLLKWMKNHRGELELIFLDIEMRGMNGMETARRLRETDETMQLVFVTGYADYVFDGYSVGAAGYILKPFSKEAIGNVARQCRERLKKERDRYFICRSGEIYYRIAKKDILYFESDRRKVHCVTEGKTYQFYGKLDEVQAAVGEDFIRIHQRYLINPEFVEQVEGSRIILRGRALPVSRSCQAAAFAALTRSILK